MQFFSQRRLKELEQDLAETRSEIKSLRFEWDELHDRLLKLYRKTSFERAKIEKASASPEPGPVEEDSSSSSNGSGFLTPKQKLIQQQILQRRTQSR